MADSKPFKLTLGWILQLVGIGCAPKVFKAHGLDVVLRTDPAPSGLEFGPPRPGGYVQLVQHGAGHWAGVIEKHMFYHALFVV